VFAFPTYQKTWQLTPNLEVNGGSGSQAQSAELFLAIHNALIGFSTLPLVVLGSSDAVTAGLDAVNRIDAVDKIVASGSGAFSWVVYQQPGSGAEICVAWDVDSIDKATVAVAIGSSFTGGSTTARPTATTEFLALDHTYWRQPEDAYKYVVHVQHTTDGKNTRVVAESIASVSGRNQRAFTWEFSVPAQAIPEWTDPYVAHIAQGYGGDGETFWSFISPDASYKNYFYGRAPDGTTVQFTLDVPGSNLLNHPDAVVGREIFMTDPVITLPYSVNDHIPLSSCALRCLTSGYKGEWGSVADLWGAPSTGVSDLLTIDKYLKPDMEEPDRVLLNMGGMAIPWELGVTAVNS
jgi:hypothetical protein